MMKTAICASLFLGLLLVSPATAVTEDWGDNVLDFAMTTQDACGSGIGTTKAALWSFEVAGSVRDPLVPGTYYPAAWKYTPYYQMEVLVDGPACFLIGYTCNIQVGDGSHFEIVSFKMSTFVTGEYKGVAVEGGTGQCGGGASISTYIAGVVPLEGQSHRLPAAV